MITAAVRIEWEESMVIRTAYTQIKRALAKKAHRDNSAAVGKI